MALLRPCAILLASLLLALLALPACSPGPTPAHAQAPSPEPSAGPTASGRPDSGRAEAGLPEPTTQPLSLAPAPTDRDTARRNLEPKGEWDELGDLVSLRRAEAALARGDGEGARSDLAGPEMRASTNRLILEQAARLAERAGDPGLAGELYALGAGYHGWTVERSRMLRAAGVAFARAGRPEAAIEQYQALVELFGWTEAAREAGAELELLGGLTPFHRGLLALHAREYGEARAAFAEAARGGDYTGAASAQLSRLAETLAWRTADDRGTAEAYRAFRSGYPDGIYAAEASFQEGLARYRAGQFEAALAVWDAVAAHAGGDGLARLRLWAGKALERLGDEDEAAARLRSAAETRPTGYYALRARDLLAGSTTWPRGGGLPEAGGLGDSAEAERWIAGWAGQGAATKAEEEARARRGFALFALGLEAEAEAEFNGVSAVSRDGSFLLRLAELLARKELWVSASRAAGRLVALSPAGSMADAPPSVQRLVYPVAFPDLVGTEAVRRQLDPHLLLALIHQESRYDPFALSVADARGLTQVLPSTARGIASALGRERFTAEDLYRPAVAVEFGAWYLANQLRAFGGDPFQGLAAYNAGAGPLRRWASPDPDLFVEQIDYPETRSYVRQIYTHHALYRALAERG